MRGKLFLGSAGSLLSLVAASGALAQDRSGAASVGSAEPDEILVTAERRTRSIQDTPLTLSVQAGVCLREGGA